jgi:hypothetical protein
MRIWRTLPLFSLVLVVCGCAPELALNPLYEEKDLVSSDALLGTWITSAATSGTMSEGLVFSFTKAGANSYEVDFPCTDDGDQCKSEVRLVRLGKFLFLDAYTPESDTPREGQSKVSLPFPQIGANILGRIWVEKDTVFMALLEDDGVKNLVEKKELTSDYATTRDGFILTGSTEDLQQQRRSPECKPSGLKA